MPRDWATELGHEVEQHDEWPRWLTISRQIVIFLLGVAVICYATTTPGHDITFLVVGLILIGMIPIEQVVARLVARPPRARAQQP